jgi:RHS repeat-associated protein
MWTPDNYIAPILDWFEKYAVSKVQVSDATTGALPVETDYDYGSNEAAWHYDDNEVVQSKYRTWGQFRGYDTVNTYTGEPTTNSQTQTTTKYYRGMDGDYLTPTSLRKVSLMDSQGGSHTDSTQLAGQPLEVTSYLGKGGPVDHSTITSYWISAPIATRSRTGLPDLNAKMAAVAETWSRQAITDGGVTTWRVTETDNTYKSDVNDDLFGVLLYTYRHTVPVDTKYDTCSSTSYAENTALNLIALPAQSETDSVACGGFTENSKPSVPSAVNSLTAPTSVIRPAQVESAVQTFYDDPSFSTTFPQTKTPTAGDVTMVRVASDYKPSTGFIWQTKTRSTYDAYGRTADTYDGNGNKTTTSYTVNSAGLTTGTTSTQPDTTVATPGATVAHHSMSVTLDPVYDTSLTSTDWNGVVTTKQYDTLGRLSSVWLNSRPITSSPNMSYAYTVSNTALSGVTANQLTEAGGTITNVTVYDSLGRVYQSQDYDVPQGGRLINETHYDTHGWAYKKNNNFWDAATPTLAALYSIPDASALDQDDYTFDGLGRVVVANSERSSVVKETATTVYNGDRTTVIPPTGGTTTATVTDPMGRTIETDQYSTTPTLTKPANTFTGLWYVTPTANTTTAVTYGYDTHGHQSTITDAAGSTWTSQYNLLGQIESKTDPVAGTATQVFDNDGQLVETQDSRGKYVSYTYDALGRKTGQYASSQADQKDGPTGNQIAGWIYDNVNAAIPDMTYPIGHATTLVSYNAGNTFTTQYTNFNAFGESLGEQYTIPASAVGSALGGTYEIDHSYTAVLGLPRTDVYAQMGGLPAETVTHGYSSKDMPQSVIGNKGYGQNVTYDAFGNVSAEKIGGGTGNNAFITNIYDDHNTSQLTQQTITRSGGSTAIDQTAYSYSIDGKINKQTETRLGSSADTETQCYTYDGLNRLAAAWTATDNCAVTPTADAHTQVANTLGTSSAYWTSWTYDQLTSGASLGNRTSQTQHAIGTATADTLTTYTYNANSTNQPSTLTSATTNPAGSSTSYGYDTAGNMTTRNTAYGNQTLTYDNANRLASVTNTGSNTSTNYVYDTNGNILLQMDATSTTLYLPTEQFTLASTNSVTGIRYYSLPGGGAAIRTSSTQYYFELPDARGTGALILDSTAQIPTWRQFDPYGNPRGTSAGWIDNRSFLNAPTDTDTGLVNLGARQYDPTVGRFTTLDPILQATDPLALNGYAYTDGDPINTADPTGQTREPIGDGSPPPSPPRDCGNGVYADGCDPGTANGDPNGPPVNQYWITDASGKYADSCTTRACIASMDRHANDPGYWRAKAEQDAYQQAVANNNAYEKDLQDELAEASRCHGFFGCLKRHGGAALSWTAKALADAGPIIDVIAIATAEVPILDVVTGTLAWGSAAASLYEDGDSLYQDVRDGSSNLQMAFDSAGALVDLGGVVVSGAEISAGRNSRARFDDMQAAQLKLKNGRQPSKRARANVPATQNAFYGKALNREFHVQVAGFAVMGAGNTVIPGAQALCGSTCGWQQPFIGYGPFWN